MDTNTTIVIVAALFVILVIVGFLIFRRKTKVDIQLPGGKLNFEGSNDPSKGKEKGHVASHGIFGNLSIGKTRLEVTGKEAIAKNVSLGDTEISLEF